VVQEGQKRNVYEIAGNKEKEERGRRNWLIIKLREGEKQNDSREGSEIGREKKADARNKGEEHCPGPGGKNIRHGVQL
jgi:hypothetical protein